MIVGVGTDLVEIARIEQVLSKTDFAFIKRVLTEAERGEFEQLNFPERFVAKRWAAKEAIAKALGTGIAQGVSFQDLHIDHDSYGKPLVRLTGRALEISNELCINNWSLSISDEKHYAVAFAIAESVKV